MVEKKEPQGYGRRIKDMVIAVVDAVKSVAVLAKEHPKKAVICAAVVVLLLVAVIL